MMEKAIQERHLNMKPNSRLFFALIFLFLPGVMTAQVRLVKEFQITRITKNFITTPKFAYSRLLLEQE